MIKKIIRGVFLFCVIVGAAEIILPVDELLQGDPNSNALYETHFKAALPGGDLWIGEYPGREYPYDLLYKGNPHPVILYSRANLLWFRDHANEFRDTYRCGLVIIFNHLYKDMWYPTGDWNGTKCYEWDDAAYMKNFIEFCHSKEYKVLMYMRTPAKKTDSAGKIIWGNQSWQDTLTGVQLFLYHNNLDGVYGDSFNCGNIWDTTQFVKRLRITVDAIAQRNGFDNGIIFSHCSASAWVSDAHTVGDDPYSDRQGLPDVMVRMHCDYINTGESMKVAPTYPGHYMMENFHNDNGLGNTLWYKLYRKSGSSTYPADVMTQAQIFQMNAQLSGCQPLVKTNETLWKATYWPIYEQLRDAWQNRKERE